MPLALTDASCLRGIWPPSLCSAGDPTLQPHHHALSAPPVILCLSFPRLLSEVSCGQAGGHHMPSAPAAPQQIPSGGDTGGTGQRSWGLVPTPQPGVGLAPHHAGGHRAPARRAGGQVGAEAVCPGRAGYGNHLPASTTPSNGIRENQGGWGAGASSEERQAVRQCCGGQLPPALLLITGLGPQPLRCPSSSRRWGALWHHGVGFPGGSACCSQPGHPSPRSQLVGEVVGGQ